MLGYPQVAINDNIFNHKGNNSKIKIMHKTTSCKIMEIRFSDMMKAQINTMKMTLTIRTTPHQGS